MKKILLILFIITMGLIDAYLAKQLLLDPIGRQFAHYKNQISTLKNSKPEEKSPQDFIKEIIKKADKKNPNLAKSQQSVEKKIQGKNVSDNLRASQNMLMAMEFTKMREKPDIKSKVVAIVRKGAIVRVIDQKGRHWKKIIYKSGGDVYEGWVDDRFFKPKEFQ
ncbi:SH3 domain-containing protein [Persephonella sp.]|uniref:SH3 domain-containing protein n=1 Tax=Persephonella sp. TaxID=2060922 RepID=UPI0026189072|nr:SH3 domain-containing protein [Persephonella sp.]